MANDFNNNVIKEFRENGGKVGGVFAPMKLLLITTTGANSGAPRTSPVAYSKNGDDFVIIASYGGGPNNPAWYHNLVANPDVTVEIGTEKFQAVASVAEPQERDRLYAAHASLYPNFLEYEKKTDRKIPAVLLARKN